MKQLRTIVAILPWLIALAAVILAITHKQVPANLEWQPLATVVAALVGGLVAVNAAVDNYVQQKWWDRRMEAYQKALDAVATLKHYNKLLKKLELHECLNRPTSQYKERMAALGPEFDIAREHLDMVAHTSPFLLSAQAIQSIASMRKAVENISQEMDYLSFLDEFDRVYGECLKHLNACAVTDLGIRNR